MIDPGPALPGHVDALLAELEARGGTGAILLTHGHSDHAQAGPIVRERTGAPLAALDPGSGEMITDPVPSTRSPVKQTRPSRNAAWSGA